MRVMFLLRLFPLTLSLFRCLSIHPSIYISMPPVSPLSSYFLWSRHTDSFRVGDLGLVPPYDEYKWNYADNMIAGYHDEYVVLHSPLPTRTHTRAYTLSRFFVSILLVPSAGFPIISSTGAFGLPC